MRVIWVVSRNARKRFLLSLQQRQKWSRPKKNLLVGDIVHLVEENIPRNKWQLARVVETYPESDRLAWKVKVLVATQLLDKNGKRCKEMSCLERPIHKLVHWQSKRIDHDSFYFTW